MRYLMLVVLLAGCSSTDQTVKAGACFICWHVEAENHAVKLPKPEETP